MQQGVGGGWRGGGQSLTIYSCYKALIQSGSNTTARSKQYRVQVFCWQSTLYYTSNLRGIMCLRLGCKEECIHLSQVSALPAMALHNNERFFGVKLYIGVPLSPGSPLSTAGRTHRKATTVSRPSHKARGLLTENQLALPYHNGTGHPPHSATCINSTL